MDDPWNEWKHPHPIIYCMVIVVCAAILLGLLCGLLLGLPL